MRVTRTMLTSSTSPNTTATPTMRKRPIQRPLSRNVEFKSPELLVVYFIQTSAAPDIAADSERHEWHSSAAMLVSRGARPSVVLAGEKAVAPDRFKQRGHNYDQRQSSEDAGVQPGIARAIHPLEKLA